MNDVPPHLTPGEIIIMRTLISKYRRQIQYELRKNRRTEMDATVPISLRAIDNHLRPRVVAAQRQIRREFYYER